MRGIFAVLSLLVFASCGGNPVSPTSPPPLPSPPTWPNPGRYLLTFMADTAACASLPAEVRSRTYAMEIDQSGSQILTLGGAGFGSVDGSRDHRGNQMALTLSKDFAELDFMDPPIIEQPDRTSTLFIDGNADGVVSGSVTELHASASVYFCGDREPGVQYLTCNIPIVGCHSANHRLTLVRQ